MQLVPGFAIEIVSQKRIPCPSLAPGGYCHLDILMCTLTYLQELKLTIGQRNRDRWKEVEPIYIVDP